MSPVGDITIHESQLLGAYGVLIVKEDFNRIKQVAKRTWNIRLTSIQYRFNVSKRNAGMVQTVPAKEKTLHS